MTFSSINNYELGLRGKIAIIGIAKRLEELYYPNDPVPLYLDKKSETLKIIQQLRNEAHRFGITFHRLKRSKGTFKNELEEIQGIGKATADSLLKEFKSVKNIREVVRQGKGEIEIGRVIGITKARVIIAYFKQPIE